MQLRGFSLCRTLACVAFALALTVPLVAPTSASAGIPQPPPGWSRAVVIQNAQRWVDLRVPYSQTSWYRGYRQDCSGFVSMAWNLHASYPTGMFYLIAKPIPKTALLPGDVMLNNTSTGAHVVLFEKWAYTDKSWYWGYEQLSSTNRPVRRLIPYPYFRHPSLFRPYRFTGLPPKPPPPPKSGAQTAPAPAPVAARRAATAAPFPQPALGRFPYPWQFVFLLTLAGACGLAWGLSGRSTP